MSVKKTEKRIEKKKKRWAGRSPARLNFFCEKQKSNKSNATFILARAVDTVDIGIQKSDKSNATFVLARAVSAGLKERCLRGSVCFIALALR